MSGIKSTLGRMVRELVQWERETPAQRRELRRRQALRIALNDKIHQAELLKQASEQAPTRDESKRLKRLSNEREGQAFEMKKELDKKVVSAEAEVYRREARRSNTEQREHGG